MRTDLPPEAFTQETLQKAFDWLQDQPEAVRAAVHTPERLVSLFRKSQRLNDVDAPVSSKKFVDDLKNLATSLDQFNSEPIAPASIPAHSSEFNQHATTNSAEAIDFTPEEKPKIEIKSTAQPPLLPETAQKSAQMMGATNFDVDPLTQVRLEAVKSRFNLSSDSEALRLLVSLGFEKFSDF